MTSRPFYLLFVLCALLLAAAWCCFRKLLQKRAYLRILGAFTICLAVTSMLTAILHHKQIRPKETENYLLAPDMISDYVKYMGTEQGYHLFSMSGMLSPTFYYAVPEDRMDVPENTRQEASMRFYFAKEEPMEDESGDAVFLKGLRYNLRYSWTRAAFDGNRESEVDSALDTPEDVLFQPLSILWLLMIIPAGLITIVRKRKIAAAAKKNAEVETSGNHGVCTPADDQAAEAAPERDPAQTASEKKVPVWLKRAGTFCSRHSVIAGVVLLAAGLMLTCSLGPALLRQQYRKADEHLKAGEYALAEREFRELLDYKDSVRRVSECVELQRETALSNAETALQAGDYRLAASYLQQQEKNKAPATSRIRAMYYSIGGMAEKDGQLQLAALYFGKSAGEKDGKARSLALWAKCRPNVTLDAGSGFSVAIGADGKILKNELPAEDSTFGPTGDYDFSAWTDVASIRAGSSHVAAIRKNGHALAQESPGVLHLISHTACTDVAGWDNLVAIAAGENRTIGLTADGRLYVSGDSTGILKDVASLVMGARNCIDVDTYGKMTAVLRADGTVFCVGETVDGLDVLTDITAISVGGEHVVCLRADGTVAACGNNDDHQCDVEDWTEIVAVSAGQYHTLGLRADGTVVACGNNKDGRCEVAQWKNVVAIAAGDGHSLGLCADGSVTACGRNYNNECEVSDWIVRLP